VIDDVAVNLEAMKLEQYVLAFVFLGSYAFALGEFIGARGRVIAIVTALAAAVAFVALTEPWELGVMVVAFALVGMGLFAGAAWLLWVLPSRWPVDARMPVRPRRVARRGRSSDAGPKLGPAAAGVEVPADRAPATTLAN
jgi:hypothetical protein